MDVWEYETSSVPPHIRAVDRLLREAGDNGWELVGMPTRAFPYFVFKRRLK